MNPFSRFDFNRLDSPDFKEDSVREELVLPLITALGYSGPTVVRSKSLRHPFVNIGSQKRRINFFPDYLLMVGSNNAWVLDAKAPNEEIRFGENVEQVYSYSIHPEIRTTYFALCNGREFALFRQDKEKSVLHFKLRDIERHWEMLERFLTPESFQLGKQIAYDPSLDTREPRAEAKFDYSRRPLLEELPVKKQEAKRHFGVHGYFTKQAWNVVQDYITNFTKPGDLVFDPFGGSGVTVIEALMMDRKAIHVDLNPMSVFIVESLITPVRLPELANAFDRVKAGFHKSVATKKSEIREALSKYKYPKGFVLPKGSDVHTIEKLFTDKQLADLALLKHLIKKEKDAGIQSTLMLMFSGLLNKVNLTYHASSGRSEGRGNSSIFAYYRYRIAKQPATIDTWTYFESRFKKVVAAKRDIELKINPRTIGNAVVVKGTATDVSFVKDQSVDYIYTDPPYGKKIPYLDLSMMWNAWLDLKVTEKDFADEAIEGGEHNKSKSEYNDLMAQSIQEMYRVLKYDRWMSFVFAHKDPEFWHLILDTAEKAGFEYAGAVKQSNGQASFKKRQNPFTVLSGQLIINFRKVKRPRAILKAHLGMDISEIVLQTIEGVIAKHHGATLEQINDELIIKGLELGFLDLLKKEYSDLTPLLVETFDYDDDKNVFTLRKNAKFKTHVDLNLRVRYYLISFLRRQQIEHKRPTFDEIVFQIMPLLKNGVTPPKQTILNVLESLAERVGDDRWHLKHAGQGSLFV